jgi:hypothetical protein
MTEIVPTLEPNPDGYDGNPAVTLAVAALRTFGGTLTRVEATALLRWWEHYTELSPREIAAVLRRFEAGEDAIQQAESGVAQPGGGWISGPSSDAPGAES